VIKLKENKYYKMILIFLIIGLFTGIAVYYYQIFTGVESVITEKNEDVLNEEEKKDKEKMKIVINTYERLLYLYEDGKLLKKYPVAIGKASTKTPIGEWAIISKGENWGGGFGTRWLGLNVPWGIYGIHGTNKPSLIGAAVSHGCIRMHNQHVEELFEIVAVKTRVTIIGKRLPINVNHVLKPGQTGLAVMQLQDNLKKYSFEPSYMDARYGPSTVSAVRELKAQYGLKNDDVSDWNVLYLLQLPDEKYHKSFK